MVRQMFAALTLLLITGCCKAQNTSCNNIKNKERTTERFDSTRYDTHKQRTEYVFEDSIKGRVRQFGGENGSEFVEYARKDHELFGTYKEYYNKTKTLKKVGRYYYNKFNIGLWKRYDENGYLIETIDKDAPYTNYPWEKVMKFVKEQLKLDLFDKGVSVNRYITKDHNIPVWFITWNPCDGKIHFVKINANTGQVIEQGANEIIE